MMVEAGKREQKRNDYLLALYELADGRVTQWTTHRAIGDSARISGADVFQVGQHLAQEKLCKFETIAVLDGNVSITPAAIARAERLYRITTRRLSDQELLRCVVGTSSGVGCLRFSLALGPAGTG